MIMTQPTKTSSGRGNLLTARARAPVHSDNEADSSQVIKRAGALAYGYPVAGAGCKSRCNLWSVYFSPPSPLP